MLLMYIDKSGDTIPISQNGKQFLVLTGCIVDETKIQNIEGQLRQIKHKYYQDYDIEIKSNFLRIKREEVRDCSLNMMKELYNLDKKIANDNRTKKK